MYKQIVVSVFFYRPYSNIRGARRSFFKLAATFGKSAMGFTKMGHHLYSSVQNAVLLPMSANNVCYLQAELPSFLLVPVSLCKQSSTAEDIARDFANQKAVRVISGS